MTASNAPTMKYTLRNLFSVPYISTTPAAAQPTANVADAELMRLSESLRGGRFVIPSISRRSPVMRGAAKAYSMKYEYTPKLKCS